MGTLVTDDREPPRREPDMSLLYTVENGLDGAFTANRDVLRTAVGVSEAQLTAHEQAYTAIVKETGLDAYSDGQRLYALVTDAAVAEARGEEPDDVRTQQWNEEARERYGPDLERTRRFVSAHPTLQTLLDNGGLGSHPEIVRRLVDHVRKIGFR